MRAGHPAGQFHSTGRTGQMVVEIDAEQVLPGLRRACPRQGTFGPASGILPACLLAVNDLGHVDLL
jgi:hypothetical protein